MTNDSTLTTIEAIREAVYAVDITNRLAGTEVSPDNAGYIALMQALSVPRRTDR